MEATVFWQIDDSGRLEQENNVFTILKMENVKGKYNHINWVHSKIDNFNLKQCLLRASNQRQ